MRDKTRHAVGGGRAKDHQEDVRQLENGRNKTKHAIGSWQGKKTNLGVGRQKTIRKIFVSSKMRESRQDRQLESAGQKDKLGSWQAKTHQEGVRQLEEAIPRHVLAFAGTCERWYMVSELGGGRAGIPCNVGDGGVAKRGSRGCRSSAAGATGEAVPIMLGMEAGRWGAAGLLSVGSGGRQGGFSGQAAGRQAGRQARDEYPGNALYGG
ncbi:hypothetical protein B0T26DRAFT_706281 [Lasiosphaeria miniovina]|uniref:Uncharacterized protein n=1 Tax=Lasiosphaeria miniovina TaxID=1954250 RepID=A0AA40AWN9_9PEZI|nr:uncharacterized protein B0T26DRAFT_706281 [Lasiosphaeria miniovina]KAK0723373.1 hypothetical protein B0T26DRAFT_706281 [Lasiosphaeria miniovina]